VCVYPAAVTNLPVAGDFGAPSLEALARLRPHYVLTVDSEDRNTGRAIAQLGIRHERVVCRTLDDIPRAIRRLGELTRRAEAAAVAGKLEAELVALRRQPRPARPVRVFLEIWGDPLMTAGKTAFLTELVELAGGENVMGDVARDFFPVSAETVLARQPEVLILLEAPDQAAAARLVAGRAGWAQLPARIVAGLDRNVLEVPGPRVLESVRLLKERLER
jgi:iron complex transport system substrate-binding protein